MHAVDLLGMGGQNPSNPHVDWKAGMVSAAARARVAKELEQDRIAVRQVQLQLHTFLKVVKQMKSVGKAASLGNLFQSQSHSQSQNRDRFNFNTNADQIDGTVHHKVTSARESVLTMYLAPLLLGNAKSWFVLHVKDGAENYTHTKTTLDAFAVSKYTLYVPYYTLYIHTTERC